MTRLSFRNRLPVWHTAAVACFVAVGAFAGHWALARLVLGQLDAALVALAETEASAVEADPRRPVRVHEFAPGSAPPSFGRLDNHNLPAAREAGSRFVNTLRPEDLGQVVQFNDRIAVLQDFTADHSALEAAIRRTHASGVTVLYDALYVVLKQLRSQGSADTPRRRAVVLLSDGEDTASLVGDEQVLELARQADVTVYVIGLRPNGAPNRERIAFIQATHFLTTLTRDTGGEVYFTDSLPALNAVYARIADELRSQYTLGYLSRNARRDGKWRRIEVRTGREDLRVRYKLGYYASKG